MSFRQILSISLAVGAILVSNRNASAVNTYYVATTTTGTADGSIDHPYTSISTAITKAVAGDTIYVRGGTYNLTSTLSISGGKSGTAANPYSLLAYPGEAPVLDFRGETYSATNAGQKGISLSANYWHIKGLTVQYAADNGISISGSNNVVEQVIARQNQDSGFLISGSNQPSNNLLLNCDSYGNFDFGAAGENADGFAVKFRGLGSGNVISGARSYDNADDGFDFWQAEHGVTVVNSWSFHNGVASVFNNPVGYQGDGNGIKLGHDSGTHVLENMLIFSNSANGVDINGNATQLEGDAPTSIPHGVTVYNTTAAFNGGKNFQFDENPTLASPPTTHTLRNDVSYTGSTTVLTGNTADHNTFNGPAGSPAGFGDSAGDFISTAIPVTTWDSFHAAGTGGDRSGTTTPTFATGPAVAPRLADGSLPLIDFMRLASGSHLVDAGVNIGLAFNGLAPDLGWSESSTGTPGDYDANGVVDLRDYIVWRDNQNPNAILPNDATPGSVDASDYDVWRSNFNPAVSGGSGSALGTAVPEPVSLVELVAAALLVPIMRRRPSVLTPI